MECYGAGDDGRRGGLLSVGRTDKSSCFKLHHTDRPPQQLRPFLPRAHVTIGRRLAAISGNNFVEFARRDRPNSRNLCADSEKRAEDRTRRLTWRSVGERRRTSGRASALPLPLSWGNNDLNTGGCDDEGGGGGSRETFAVAVSAAAADNCGVRRVDRRCSG